MHKENHPIVFCLYDRNDWIFFFIHMIMCKFVWNGPNTCLTIMSMQMNILFLSLVIFIASLLVIINPFHLFLFFRLCLFQSKEISKKLISLVYHGCVRGDTTCAMNANATNAILEAR